MSSSIDYDRLILRQRLLQRHPYCALCRVQKATDLHEIVSRGRTASNHEARRLSYVAELVVPLCRACHERAHNPAIRKRLLAYNISLYGRERVVKALEVVQEHLHHQLDIWSDLEEVLNETRT